MDFFPFAKPIISFLWLAMLTIRTNAALAVTIVPFYRLKLFRETISGTRSSWKDQIIIGCGAGLFNIFIPFIILLVGVTPYIPLFAGYYSGWLAGLIAGIFSAYWVFAVFHWHPVIVILFIMQGFIGFYLKRHNTLWKKSRFLSSTGPVTIGIPLCSQNRSAQGPLLRCHPSETYASGAKPSLPLVFTGSIISTIIWLFSPHPGVTEPNIFHLPPPSIINAILHQLISLSFVLYWFCRLLEYLAEEEKRQNLAKQAQEQQLLLQETRYKFLKAQIQPHFLFNALSTIASIVTEEPARGAELIKKLSKFLLQSFAKQQNLIPLEEDLEFLRAYLAIEKARFGDRLNIEFEIDEKTLKILIPPMLIQPLVENAIKHGVSKRAEGGTVSVKINLNDKGVCFEITNDGDWKESGEKKIKEKSSGVGLSNVRERVYEFAGKDNNFTITSIPGKGVSVSFCLPQSDKNNDKREQ